MNIYYNEYLLKNEYLLQKKQKKLADRFLAFTHRGKYILELI